MIIEYMLIMEGGEKKAPSWVFNGGSFFNPADFTYIGTTKNANERDFYLPDTVVTLTKQQLIDRVLKIHKTQVVPNLNSNLKPGTIYSVMNDELILQTQNGGLKLIEVQPESKPRMPISEFLKSYLSLNKIEKGDRFV